MRPLSSFRPSDWKRFTSDIEDPKFCQQVLQQVKNLLTSTSPGAEGMKDDLYVIASKLTAATFWKKFDLGELKEIFSGVSPAVARAFAAGMPRNIAIAVTVREHVAGLVIQEMDMNLRSGVMAVWEPNNVMSPEKVKIYGRWMDPGEGILTVDKRAAGLAGTVIVGGSVAKVTGRSGSTGQFERVGELGDALIRGGKKTKKFSVGDKDDSLVG